MNIIIWLECLIRKFKYMDRQYSAEKILWVSNKVLGKNCFCLKKLLCSISAVNAKHVPNAKYVFCTCHSCVSDFSRSKYCVGGGKLDEVQAPPASSGGEGPHTDSHQGSLPDSLWLWCAWWVDSKDQVCTGEQHCVRVSSWGKFQLRQRQENCWLATSWTLNVYLTKIFSFENLKSITVIKYGTGSQRGKVFQLPQIYLFRLFSIDILYP